MPTPTISRLLLLAACGQLVACGQRALPTVADDFCSGPARATMGDDRPPTLLTETGYDLVRLSTPPIPAGVEIDPDDFPPIAQLVVSLRSADRREDFTLRLSGPERTWLQIYRDGAVDLGQPPDDLTFVLHYGFTGPTKGGTALAPQATLDGWLRLAGFSALDGDCPACTVALCLTVESPPRWRVFADGVLMWAGD